LLIAAKGLVAKDLLKGFQGGNGHCLKDGYRESKSYIIVAADQLALRLQPDAQVRAIPKLLGQPKSLLPAADRRMRSFVDPAYVAPASQGHSRPPLLTHAGRCSCI